LDYRVRNLLLIIITLSLFASAFIGARRFVVEHRDRSVELAMDWDDIVFLSRSEGVNVNTLLKKLKEVGIQSIALCEDTLDSAERKGLLTWIRGSDAFNVFRITAKASLYFRKMLQNDLVDPGKYYIRFTNVPLYRKVRDELFLTLGRGQVRELEGYILEVEDDEWNLAFLGIGIPGETYSFLKGQGFKVLPRFKNSPRLTSDNISRKFNLQGISFDDNIMLFDEEEVMGYPYNLDATAAELSSRDMIFGYIEFSEQLGDKRLANLMGEKTIRIHSIPNDEMEIMSNSQALARFMRAVNERSVRLLYIHPIPRPAYGSNLIETNLEYISRIGASLKRAGYTLGDSKTSHRLRVGFIASLFIILGITAASLLLLSRFITVPDWFVYITILGSVPLAFIFFYAGKLLILRKLAAFAGAVVFPSLAIIIPFASAKLDEASKSLWSRLARIPIAFGIAGSGALLIVGLLSDTLFKVGAEQFSGVKLALILPMAIVAAYFFLEGSFDKTARKLARFLKSQLSVGHLLLLGFFGFFVLIFILRSGNFGIAVPGFERRVRDIIEMILMVRPRTKEFLLGYPAMILVALYYNKIPREWIWLPLTIATVAVISFVNTFCHIHSPLLLSFIRSVNGLVVGIIIGLVFAGLIELTKKLAAKYG